MKLGFFMMPLHSLNMSYPDMYAMDMEAALYAEEQGYEELWIGEHYSASVEPISNSLQFMSWLIPQTKRIKLCTGVLNLPHHHPAKIAADVALFDHMAKGRFIMGIGPGGLASDFELFGTTNLDRQEMMVESIDLVHRIWSSDPPYAFKGRYWNIKIQDTVQPDMGIGPIPKPLQKPFPTVVTSAMSPFSGTARLAGQRGWELISANFNAPWVVRSQWDKYAEGADAVGRKADPTTWRISRSLLITETDQEAADYLADSTNTIRSYYNYLFTQLSRAGAIKIFLPDPQTTPETLTLQAVMDSMVVAGSAETVLDKLVAFRDQVGPFGGLLCAFHEWDRRPMWKQSIGALAHQVMPAFEKYMLQTAAKI
jgi:alkanesulfonate monooxygenase SsuD/methylene tetrahydromethanopterin reductase-like flavin-dependent oxidoreductase (luciferase family)